MRRSTPLLGLAMAGCALLPHREEADVSLWLPDPVSLTASAQVELQGLIEELLETSNFNTARHAQMLGSTRTRVQAAYEAAVAGRHITVAYPTQRTSRTIGGDIAVQVVTAGLNGDRFADSLFTVDAQSEVVQHEKYSGMHAIRLLQAVEARSGR